MILLRMKALWFPTTVILFLYFFICFTMWTKYLPNNQQQSDDYQDKSFRVAVTTNNFKTYFPENRTQSRIENAVHPNIIPGNISVHLQYSNGTGDLKNNSQEPTATGRRRQAFIPNFKDIDTFRRDVEFLNRQGYIHNKDKFSVKLTADSIVILVQVHSRAELLEMQIDSFREMRYINETLVIFSHDFFSQDVFDVIAKIDFCPYMQIFYPYPIQVYSKQFPGEDPNDCPRNITEQDALKLKCINAKYPDFYGHYREAAMTQMKHHWVWKLQFIFENCSLLRNFEGIVFRIEEDYYLAEDTIYYLRKLDQQSQIQCPECKMYLMGYYSPFDITVYNTGGAVKYLWYLGLGRGMALRKDFWNLFKNCSETFCRFDDYNWGWSLNYISASCIAGGLKTLKPLGSRVFHLGVCKGLNTKKDCKATDVLQKVHRVLNLNKKDMFPNNVTVTRSVKGKPMPRKYGGWGDIRDQEMCLRISKGQSLSTADFRNMQQNLFN